MLERYLYQVEKYLPKADKKEVTDELKSIILDQLEESGKTDDVEALRLILIEFGHPLEVAARYRNQKPLVLRELEPIMLMIIKIVSISIPFALLIATVLGAYSDIEGLTTGGLFLEILKAIPGMIMAVVSSFGFIFLIFIAISQAVKPEDISTEEFKPENLARIPKNIYKVSIIESMISVIGGIVILYILNYQTGIVAIYYDGVREPLLNDTFTSLLPLINVSVLATLVINLYYLIQNSKDNTSIIIEAMFKVYSGILFILFATKGIFNDVIVDGISLSIIPTMITIGMWAGAIGSFVAAIQMFAKVFTAKEKR